MSEKQIRLNANSIITYKFASTLSCASTKVDSILSKISSMSINSSKLSQSSLSKFSSEKTAFSLDLNPFSSARKRKPKGKPLVFKQTTTWKRNLYESGSLKQARDKRKEIKKRVLRCQSISDHERACNGGIGYMRDALLSFDSQESSINLSPHYILNLPIEKRDNYCECLTSFNSKEKDVSYHKHKICLTYSYVLCLLHYVYSTNDSYKKLENNNGESLWKPTNFNFGIKKQNNYWIREKISINTEWTNQALLDLNFCEEGITQKKETPLVLQFVSSITKDEVKKLLNNRKKIVLLWNEEENLFLFVEITKVLAENKYENGKVLVEAHVHPKYYYLLADYPNQCWNVYFIPKHLKSGFQKSLEKLAKKQRKL